MPRQIRTRSKKSPENEPVLGRSVGRGRWERWQRTRQIPLIPEPYSKMGLANVTEFARSTQSQPMAEGGWLPNFNIVQYREGLSAKKQAKLDKRASKLSKHAAWNMISDASEFSWEADFYHDVFGMIRNDSRLKMDKRPYNFIETDSEGKTFVRKRIPDTTIGLRAYCDEMLKLGYTCNVPDCEEDHSDMQPLASLSRERMLVQHNKSQCGLVVDGVWGCADLVFPFAIYEAKKKMGASILHGASQVNHALRTYMAMLDDLARNPDNVQEYQTPESRDFRMFGFTSEGSYWRVYVAFECEWLEGITIETLWSGNVEDFSRAYDLLCIVDQIHEYGAVQHRNFVSKHIEPWLTKGERLQQIENEKEEAHRKEVAKGDFDWITYFETYKDDYPGWLQASYNQHTVSRKRTRPVGEDELSLQQEAGGLRRRE